MVVAAFNQERALEGAFSVIVKLRRCDIDSLFAALVHTRRQLSCFGHHILMDL